MHTLGLLFDLELKYDIAGKILEKGPKHECLDIPSALTHTKWP